MKNIIFLLSAVTLLTSYSAHADDQCFDSLSSHIDVMESSEEFIKTLAPHAERISSYEIIQLQKNLTKRYLSLNNLLSVYENNPACAPKALGKAVAIYDFTKIGESIFANKHLRRVVLSFIKHKTYQLTDFKKSYEYYTTHEVISAVEYELQSAPLSEKLALPLNLDFKRPKYERDPNLSAPSDLAIKGTIGVVSGAARVWGFISDKFVWRKGRLNLDEKAHELMFSSLRPLDLIYETRNYVLSNYTIPGHWGHVSIWLGKKDELIDLGVWDEPFFAPLRAQVEAGKNILEIRKEGAVFKDLKTFLNLDETAITRVEGIERRAPTVYRELIDQLGKKYDFKFDSRSADKITCAELIAFTYGDLKWHETKTLFQNSLSPDDIALSTLDSSSAVKFILYLKGNKDQDFSNLGFEEWKDLYSKKKDRVSTGDLLAPKIKHTLIFSEIL